MSLQNLIDQYVAKMRDINQLIEEKALVEQKLVLMKSDRTSIRKEINSLFSQKRLTVQTFLATVEGKPTVVQIDLRSHPEHEDFLTFCEVTPIEEFAQPSSVSTEDVFVSKYEEDPQWDEMKNDR